MQKKGIAKFLTRIHTNIMTTALIFVEVLKTVYDKILELVVGMSETLCKKLISAPGLMQLSNIMPENSPIVSK